MKKIRGKEVVFEYANFGETLNNEDLSSLRSPFTKPPIEMLSPGNILIVDFKKDPGIYFLIKIISSNLDNSKNFIDLRKVRKQYENLTFLDSIKNSVGIFFNNEINESNYLNAPDHPLVRQNFIKYQKGIRHLKKEMFDLIQSNQYIPFDFYFGNVNDLSKMTSLQLLNRENLLKDKEKDPAIFNQVWVNGDYHLATIISRLELTKYQETLMMREEILKRNNISVEIKDYGLTISEIYNGLELAKKVMERYLYKSFTEGNINLKAILLIIRNSDNIDQKDQFFVLKTIQTLTNDFDMRYFNEDPNKYNQIKKVIKKYNLPVHNNWKKE